MRPKLYILAGGRSSRFGSDKARASVMGQPLIAHVAGRLAAVTAGPTVVAATAGAFEDLGLRTIGDIVPGCGPMGGLHAALHDCGPDQWLLLVSCDFVGADGGLAGALIDRIGLGGRAIAFRHDRWEPIFALYHSSLRDEVDRRVAGEQLAMQRLLDDVGADAVALPAGWPAIAQVNTDEEFNRWKSGLEAAARPVTLRVLLFGPAATAVGRRQVDVAVSAARPTVAELRAAMAQGHPELAGMLAACRFGVGHEFASEDRVLREGDEIALIGMVSGG